jgi:hypothetical protein
MDAFEMFGGKRLNSGLCTHRRKDRRDQVAMRRGEYTRTGAAIFGCNGKFKHKENYTTLKLVCYLEGNWFF